MQLLGQLHLAFTFSKIVFWCMGTKQNWPIVFEEFLKSGKSKVVFCIENN
jgi:hypothetical protein